MSHIFLMVFIYSFVTHRYTKGKTIGICVASCLLLTLSDVLKLSLFPDSSLCYVIVTLFQIFVTQSTGIYISRTRDNRVLFMSLSASNYCLTGSISSSIFYIYTGNVCLSLSAGFLIHLAILLILYSRIRKIWLKAYEGQTVKIWWELCLIPVFFYCSFSFLAFFPYTLYDNPHNIPGVTFFMVTMFVSYVTVFRYVKSEADNSGIYLKNVLFESYIRGLESQYHLVEQSEQNLKILRHDMRHFSHMIDSLLNQGEYAEIRKITDHIHEVADENRVIKYCENIIVNSILSEMMKKAGALAIDIHLDVIVPRELPVSDYELALVTANLLENAINGVKDLEKTAKTVDVKLRCGQDHLLIRMKNPYEQEIVFDSLTGLPKSQKGKNHGLGMQSVSAFADRTGGNIDCFCEDGIFQIILFAKFQGKL